MATEYLDVIILTKDRQAQLFRAVSSILAGKILPAKIIIIDSGKDHCLKNNISTLCNRVQIELNYIIKKNIGVSEARNTGISYSRAKYFGFIDDDQTPSPTWITAINLKDFSQYVAIGGKRQPRYPHNYWHQVWNHTESNFNNRAGKSAFIPTGNSLYLSSFIKNNNIKFHPHFDKAAAEDVHFCFQILKHKGKIKYDPSITVIDDFRSTFIDFVKQWFSYGLGTHKYHNTIKPSPSNQVRKSPSEHFSIRLKHFVCSYYESTRIFSYKNASVLIYPGLLVRDLSFFCGHLYGLISLQ